MITHNQASAKMPLIYELAEIPVVFTNFYPWHFGSSSTFDHFWTCLIHLTISMFSIQDHATVGTFDTVDSAH